MVPRWTSWLSYMPCNVMQTGIPRIHVIRLSPRGFSAEGEGSFKSPDEFVRVVTLYKVASVNK